MPAVQTAIVKHISSYLSSELKTTVKIGFVHFEPFKSVVLHDLFIKDQHNDTLLYTELLRASVSVFDAKKEILALNKVLLKNARIKLQQYPNEDVLNLQFIVDYFSASEKDSSAPWKVSAGALTLDNIVFSLLNNRQHADASVINFNDLYISPFNATFKNIQLGTDSISCSIDNLSLKEKSGLELTELSSSDFVYSSQFAWLKKLKVKMPGSEIHTNVAFRYDSPSDFNDFINKVEFTSAFDKTNITSSDLASLIPGLKNFNRPFSFSGTAKGKVSELRLKDFELTYGKHTHFKGKANLNGLPDVKETFIDLVVEDFTTSKADIETIPVDNNNFLVVPAEIGKLGVAKFKGKFTGFYNDFVAYGNLNTELGFVSSDVNIKFDKTPTYSGNISTINFDLGKLASMESTFGKVTMKVNVKGTHFDIKKLTAFVEGNITDIDVLNYHYNNISLKADVSKKLFNGSLVINEPDINMEFNGTVDYTKDIPLFDFKARLKDVKIAKLHLVKRDTSATLSVNTDIQITGNSPDNFEGYIRLKDIKYSENEKTIWTNAIDIQSETQSNTRQVFILSEYGSLNITGSYRRTSVIQAFIAMLKKYLPAAEERLVTVNEIQDFHYDLQVKNLEPIFSIFNPSIYVAPGTTANGSFSSLNNDFDVTLSSERIVISDFEMNKLLLKGNTAGRTFRIDLKAAAADFRDSIVFKDVLLSGNTNKDSASFNLLCSGRDSLRDYFNINGILDFTAAGKTTLQFVPSTLKIDSLSWTVDSRNTITIDSTFVTFNNFNFTAANQQVGFNGVLGKNEADVLRVGLDHFNVKALNKVLAAFDIQTGGIATGTVLSAGTLESPKITTDLEVKDFMFFNDTIGDAMLLVEYAIKNKSINIDATFSKNEVRTIGVNGKYLIEEKQDKLDFIIKVNKTNLHPFSHYLRGFASDVRGIFSGDFTLRGPASDPALEGTARLQKASLVIDYLNTRYSFSDEIKITKGGFEFKNITLNDSLGNQAKINGTIYHRKFYDFWINMDISTRKFLCLSTTARQNSLFFGTGYVSGRMNISGPFENISFNGSIRSERGTEISFPLSNPDEITSSSFITFINADTTKKDVEEDEAVDLSGINMKLELDITEDALIKLIYDDKIGDKMEGRGNGNIIMFIGADGTFEMRGDYVLESGSYVFTLQNVINKKFTMRKGGTIRWNGSPYDATIDIDAVYSLRASLYDLMRDTSSNYSNRVTVELILSLENKLLNPDIKFDINIPDIDAATQSMMRTLIPTEDDKNKQTLSLLVINRFQPGKGREDRFEASSSGIGANASEFLSLQLSSWLDQLTDKVDIGVNYRPGDRISNEQLEVMLGTRLFNERLTIETNVGFSGNNTSNNTEQNTSGIVGDFNLDVKLTEDGKFHFKAFNRSNNINFLNNFNSLYTQGIGFFYRHEFNSLKEIFNSKKEEEVKTEPVN